MERESVESVPATAKTVLSPEHAIAFYSEAVKRLLQGSEDVGSGFAEEARKIHYHEAPSRSIRGQASDEDFEELKEEGIDVIKLLVFRDQEDLN